jgi:hypothetical protein
MYDDAFKNNKADQKAKTKAYFEKWDNTDLNARKVWINKMKVTPVPMMGIKRLEFKIEVSTLENVILKPIVTDKKKRRRN